MIEKRSASHPARPSAGPGAARWQFASAGRPDAAAQALRQARRGGKADRIGHPQHPVDHAGHEAGRHSRPADARDAAALGGRQVTLQSTEIKLMPYMSMKDEV